MTNHDLPPIIAVGMGDEEFRKRLGEFGKRIFHEEQAKEWDALIVSTFPEGPLLSREDTDTVSPSPDEETEQDS
ncbi:MAG: hypothetical protein JWO96_402 [Candidatus Saccharibacteria bacterium]|nr:hypothetical protein [Candidatus Saccharibacteria bacterium]